MGLYIRVFPALVVYKVFVWTLPVVGISMPQVKDLGLV